ncbi:hypothetical protein F7725_021700, partial [Dissostichus mawsoni]
VTAGHRRDCSISHQEVFYSSLSLKSSSAASSKQVLSVRMAGRLSLQEVDLSCSICCEIFRDPVVLKCSHSFCAPCLQQYWTRGTRSRDCPLCRSESVDDPVPSLTLKNLCDSYIQEGEGLEDPAGELYSDPGEMCPLHGERLKLFCLQDKEPICVVCHTSRKHKQHDFCPVSEAVVDVKEKMKTALSSMHEKKDAFNNMKKQYENTSGPICGEATREEFEKLHSFLLAEEEARMDTLRGEEEHKSREMMQRIEEITRNIEYVSESIRVLEEEIASEGISILHKCKSTLARADRPIEDPVMAPGALVDVAQYLGVCDSEEKQKMPDNPERFDPDTGVLGRESFTSGKHAWDVNVGDSTAWVVGLAKESVQRKEKVSSVLKNGYLCVYFYHKMYFAGTSPLTRLNLKRNPQRIRVQLDCDKGRVSFYDPHDNTNIYTFKHAITERVFPYFWVGCQQCPLKVEPLEVSVKAVEYF